MSLFKSKPRTLRQDLRATRKSAIRTAFFVVLLVSGIVPAFTLLFGSSEGVELSMTDRVSPIWDVFIHTYPLTLAIAVITYSRKQKWLRWGKWFFAASVIVLGATLSNTLSEFTGHATIEQANIFGDFKNPLFGIPAAGFNYFIGFYNHYGAGPFLASLLVGIFAGKTASRLGRYVPHDEQQVKSSATALVKELVDSRRRAA